MNKKHQGDDYYDAIAELLQSTAPVKTTPKTIAARLLMKVGDILFDASNFFHGLALGLKHNSKDQNAD